MKTQKLNITPDNFTRLDNDFYGNPCYYISVVSFFPVCPENMGVLEKADYIDKARKHSGLVKYRGKKYGSGYVVQSYNLDYDCKLLNEFFNNK